MVLDTLAQQLNISPEILIILIIWTVIWKGLALWKSAKLDQPIWFALMLVINTIGVVEIIYLILYSKHSVPTTLRTSLSKRKVKRKR